MRFRWLILLAALASISIRVPGSDPVARPPEFFCDKRADHPKCELDPSPTPSPSPTPTASPSPTPSPSPSPSPQPSPSPPDEPNACSGVSVAPGADIAALSASQGPYTTFCLDGTYRVRTRVVPKDGQRFVGPAVLIGDGADYAFTGTAREVGVEHLDISGFNPPEGRGAVNGRDGVGWYIAYNEVHHNATGGVYVGAHSVARANRIHHNGQIGIKAKYASPVVENNEIAWNNFEKRFSFTHEAGGSKFSHTTGLVVRGNWVHDNWGPGLWTDINNSGTRYLGNRVEDNADAGIFHEVSCSAEIFENVVRRNGFARGDWLWGAGIQIASSNDVEVAYNVVEDNANAIALIQQDRSKRDCGSTVVENARVHHNTIRLAGGKAGGVDDYQDLLFERNNSWDHNTWTLGSVSKPFKWDGDLDFAGWSALWDGERSG